MQERKYVYPQGKIIERPISRFERIGLSILSFAGFIIACLFCAGIVMAARNSTQHKACEERGGTYQYHLLNDNECVSAPARR